MMNKIQDRLQSTDAYISLALGLAVVLMVGALVINNFRSNNKQKPLKQSATDVQNSTLKNVPNSNEYIVKEGDTLWSIAQDKYSSGYNWTSIRDANNITDANSINAGQKLILPKVTPIVLQGQILSDGAQVEASPPTQKQASTKPSTYTVESGDSLWTIAVKIYNDGYMWVNIAKANHLDDPGLIFSGNVLTLP